MQPTVRLSHLHNFVYALISNRAFQASSPKLSGPAAHKARRAFFCSKTFCTKPFRMEDFPRDALSAPICGGGGVIDLQSLVPNPSYQGAIS